MARPSANGMTQRSGERTGVLVNELWRSFCKGSITPFTKRGFRLPVALNSRQDDTNRNLQKSSTAPGWTNSCDKAVASILGAGRQRRVADSAGLVRLIYPRQLRRVLSWLSAAQIQQSRKTNREFVAKIAEVMKQHPDAHLFAGLRGTRSRLLPRVYSVRLARGMTTGPLQNAWQHSVGLLRRLVRAGKPLQILGRIPSLLWIASTLEIVGFTEENAGECGVWDFEARVRVRQVRLPASHPHSYRSSLRPAGTKTAIAFG